MSTGEMSAEAGRGHGSGHGEGLVIESLYPEFSNQGGDNGNMMYLRACLPEAEVVETRFGEAPAFATRGDVSLVYAGYMTERQQRLAAGALAPYADALRSHVARGGMGLFTGNAAELLGRFVVTDAGERFDCLGLFDFVARQDFSSRQPRVFMGAFDAGEPARDPLAIVGYRIGFTEIEGDDAAEPFCRVTVGPGLNAGSAFEGYRRDGLVATWLCGPILPLNPLFTGWILGRLGVDAPVAFERQAMAAYEKRVEEFKTPGIKMPI